MATKTATVKKISEGTQALTPIKIVEPENSSMTLEIIGPKLAHQYLGVAAENRNVREGSVAQYARDMIADKWHSSVIRFDTEGKLRDGQHRLKAIVLSKTEQLFWVERNVPVEAFRSIDTGIKRTMADILAISGERNVNVLATGIRYAAWLENFPGVGFSSASTIPMSPDETFNYLNNNGRVRESASLGQKVASSIKYPPSMAAALHYLGVKTGNEEYADRFWDQMISGAGIIEFTGPWALRKIVIDDQLRHKYDGRLDRNMLFALSLKAWNYWKHDLFVRRLQWLRNADEPFPKFNQRPKITKDGKLTPLG